MNKFIYIANIICIPLNLLVVLSGTATPITYLALGLNVAVVTLGSLSR